jgi:hypothetical protein
MRRLSRFANPLSYARNVTSAQAPIAAPYSMEVSMRKLQISVVTSSRETADSRKVRIGAQAPSLPRIVRNGPAVTADSRKVRLGAQAPSLPRIVKGSAAIADSRKVRLGAQAPSLPIRIAKAAAAAAVDSRKVRLGAQAPSLPRK